MPSREDTHRCHHCWQKYQATIEVAVCCLWAPLVRLGWCAWCGVDTPKGRTFCNRACASSYGSEAWERGNRTPHTQRGTSKPSFPQ